MAEAEEGAEVEAAAVEAVLCAEIRTETGYWGRERGEVPATETRGWWAVLDSSTEETMGGSVRLVKALE